MENIFSASRQNTCTSYLF